MARTATTRINEFAPNRHSVYLKSTIVNDPSFPFDIGEELRVRIEGETLVLERE